VEIANDFADQGIKDFSGIAVPTLYDPNEFVRMLTPKVFSQASQSHHG
jgi:hypothetical protein